MYVNMYVYRYVFLFVYWRLRTHLYIHCMHLCLCQWILSSKCLHCHIFVMHVTRVHSICARLVFATNHGYARFCSFASSGTWRLCHVLCFHFNSLLEVSRWLPRRAVKKEEEAIERGDKVRGLKNGRLKGERKDMKPSTWNLSRSLI